MQEQPRIVINILQEVGAFAENKDVAAQLREQQIMPALKLHKIVRLNFQGVTSATQSFVHALISEAMRVYTANVLDQIEFKECNDKVRKIIIIVTDYMQQSDAA